MLPPRYTESSGSGRRPSLRPLTLSSKAQAGDALEFVSWPRPVSSFRHLALAAQFSVPPIPSRTDKMHINSLSSLRIQLKQEV